MREGGKKGRVEGYKRWEIKEEGVHIVQTYLAYHSSSSNLLVMRGKPFPDAPSSHGRRG